MNSLLLLGVSTSCHLSAGPESFHLKKLFNADLIAPKGGGEASNHGGHVGEFIDGNSVSIERGSLKRTLPLDEFADMASMVRSLTATFRGDQVSIEQFFKWKLSGPSERWQLVLTPKSSKLFITLKEIRLSGDNAYVHTVETTLTDGDRSLMTLSRPVALPTE